MGVAVCLSVGGCEAARGLAHGAQAMIGAYAAASLTGITGNFYFGALAAIPITFLSGYVLEYLLIRHLYQRDHMDQVLATFGLILFFNELIRIGFGPAALYSNLPPSLSGFVYILPDTPYPVYRIVVIGVGLICAAGIHHLVTRTKIGAMVRAGANNETMAAALGVNIGLLRRFIFSAGACFAGIAGIMLGPLTAVEPGMGEPLLILSLVVIIIGGLGSVRGAFIAALVASNVWSATAHVASRPAHWLFASPLIAALSVAAAVPGAVPAS